MMDGILISETFIILYIYQTTVHRPLQHENKIDSGRRFWSFLYILNKREELNKREVATELDVKRQKYSTFVDLFRIHADRRRKLPNN